MTDESGRWGGPERLRVYALAQDLAVAIDRIFGASARDSSLAYQARRAVDSIVLNIAEGSAHRSPGKKIYHYELAHGSAAECIAALTRLHRRNPSPAIHSARRTANMIGVMLNALICTHEERR